MSRTWRLVFGLAVTVALASQASLHASSQPSSLTVIQLETNAAADPLGIDDSAPRFSWALKSERRGISQTAFRVLVASKPELAREGRADVWDSKQVSSPDPFVVYQGPALK